MHRRRRFVLAAVWYAPACTTWMSISRATTARGIATKGSFGRPDASLERTPSGGRSLRDAAATGPVDLVRGPVTGAGGGGPPRRRGGVAAALGSLVTGAPTRKGVVARHVACRCSTGSSSAVVVAERCRSGRRRFSGAGAGCPEAPARPRGRRGGRRVGGVRRGGAGVNRRGRHRDRRDIGQLDPGRVHQALIGALREMPGGVSRSETASSAWRCVALLERQLVVQRGQAHLSVGKHRLRDDDRQERRNQNRHRGDIENAALVRQQLADAAGLTFPGRKRSQRHPTSGARLNPRRAGVRAQPSPQEVVASALDRSDDGPQPGRFGPTIRGHLLRRRLAGAPEDQSVLRPGAAHTRQAGRQHIHPLPPPRRSASSVGLHPSDS